MRKILHLLTHSERREAAVLMCLMFVGMLLETLGLGLVVPAMALLTQDDVARGYPMLESALEAVGISDRRSLIVGGLFVLVAIYVVKALFLAVVAWRQTRFAFRVRAELSQRLFALYLRQPYAFHLQRNSAQLIRNVIGSVNQFMFEGIIPAMVLVTESLVLIGVGVLLLATEPVGALVVLALVGTAAWGFHQLSRNRATRWGTMYEHHEELRLQHLQQGLGGVKDVKLLGREAEFLRQYGIHNLQSAEAGQFQQTLLQLPRLGLEVLAISGLAIVVSSMLWQGRAPAAVLPVLAMFAAAAFRLIPSVNRVLTSKQHLRFCLPVIATLHEELCLSVPDVSHEQPSVPSFCTSVGMRGVSYGYPGGATLALQDITLEIRRGESVGFVGPSGSGKSTLVDIVLGLLTPDSGEIVVDGQDIRSNVRQWQDQLGYVPQAIYLTDDTLRRNVAFGIPENRIDEGAVRRAISAARLDEFVTSLPAGLETIVGERGVRLSGGQRQRIGIARALYHDPAVLVLDEATSSLDTATEREVMNAVTALRGSKTILIVAHRLSTVEGCDRLFALNDGRLTPTDAGG